MNFIRPIAMTAALTFLGSAAWAAEQDDHNIHHPEAAASSNQAPAGAVGDAAVKQPMTNMATCQQMMMDRMPATPAK